MRVAWEIVLCLVVGWCKVIEGTKISSELKLSSSSLIESFQAENKVLAQLLSQNFFLFFEVSHKNL